MVEKMKSVQKETDELVNSIQVKVNKLKREREIEKRKEPRVVDVICTEEDIERTRR